MTSPPQIKQVLPDVAWTVEPLLTEEECQRVIQQATQAGIQTSPGPGDLRHRNCCTHYFRDERLSAAIWQRLQATGSLPNRVTFDRLHMETPPTGFRCDDIRDMLGQWKAYGINPQYTLLYYTPGGHFGPHRDGYKVLSEHERSLLTVCTYLTARPTASGGATQFLCDEMDLLGPDATTGRIEAPTGTVRATVEGNAVGKAAVFWHDVMHQGQPLVANSAPKWLLITQVLFVRDPSTAPQWTTEQRLARDYLKQAEAAEVAGNIPEAIRCYNKAFKLDPSLE